MEDEAAASIMRGLEQALAIERGEADPSQYRVHIPAEIDTRAIRGRMGMSKEEFAAAFELDAELLSLWEEGRRVPDAAASAYLRVIDRVPTAVQDALNAA